ncbi:aldehyde reductase [Mycobacterium tuberculosis]|nr:aldehyde reductase [Mycobacterium tuberculosis]CNW31775.1 aldehyde reductase [Mycobacterium tuberculosis]
MKTTAAVLFEAGKPFELMELDLDGPGPGEVLVKYTAAGLCHSDLHLTDGDLPPRFPIVGGHEGSGVIEEVGAGVTRVKPGDHVVCSFIPNCGTCRYCCTGRQNLCDMGPPSWRAACRTAVSDSIPREQISAPCACWARSPSGPPSRSIRW